LGKEKVILGFPWLQKEDPVIHWDKGAIKWKDNAPKEEEMTLTWLVR
jgi:hypothetical protein